jgi:hypothetical protein
VKDIVIVSSGRCVNDCACRVTQSSSRPFPARRHRRAVEKINQLKREIALRDHAPPPGLL